MLCLLAGGAVRVDCRLGDLTSELGWVNPVNRQ